MARDILFRGKAFDTKEWIEGYLYVSELEKKSGFAWVYGENEERTLVALESVGQYTGLTDKNGVKIFDGDVVKGGWETIGSIYWDDDFLQFRIKLLNGHNREIDYYGVIEVIGNVFANPELMAGGK